MRGQLVILRCGFEKMGIDGETEKRAVVDVAKGVGDITSQVPL